MTSLGKLVFRTALLIGAISVISYATAMEGNQNLLMILGGGLTGAYVGLGSQRGANNG